MPRSRRIPGIQSLVWSTDIDVLEIGRRVERRDDHWVVSSPSTPEFWWGNFLLFDDPPRAGDRERWEDAFEAAFGDDRRIAHRAFGWDRTDGDRGAAESEFAAGGYILELSAGLCTAPEGLRRHPREHRAVTVRALEPDDDRLWDQVAGVQLDDRLRQPGAPSDPELTRRFIAGRLRAQRRLLASGRGAWYVALDGSTVVGSLGIVVTDGRARYQTVDTLTSHRRRGIASRLVAEAGEDIASRHPVDRLVIVADPDYHAIGLYEDLGFLREELVCGVCLEPDR